MAKFYGLIGYVETTQIRSGVWEDTAIEKHYVGDILKNTKRWQSSGDVLDDIDLAIRVSIVADAYANENLFAIKYVKWMGAYWKVTSIDADRPRLILTIGGVYNGPTVGTS